MNEDRRAKGAWVFLSHSHKDLERVREIRNALEAKGHNPLMFFLKCLDDDSELDDLIRREIEARTWFLLCESPNAKGSRWVQAEVEMIKGLEGKVYEVIDLEDDLDAQLERVAALSKRATVFISHARRDTNIAEAIRAALLEEDFAVFWPPDDLLPGEPWESRIFEEVDRAVQRGFFLLLLSLEALDSEWMRHEVDYALQQGVASGRPSNIVPIIARNGEAVRDALASHPDMRFPIGGVQLFDLTTGDLHERIAELIKSLMTREME